MMIETDAGSQSSGNGIPIWVAILVGLITSLIQSLGLTIQRKSHVQNDAKPLEERKKAIQRPLWLFGFAIFLSSNIFGTVFQIGALPIVILAPLGAVSLLWNALLSLLLLRESFPLSTLFGTLLIGAGCAFIAIFGVVPEENQNHSLEELLVLFGRPGFVGYYVGMGGVVVVVLIISHIAEWRIRRKERLGQITLPADPLEPPTTPPSSFSHHHLSSTPLSPGPSEAGSTLTTNKGTNSIPFRIKLGNRRWSAPATPPQIPGRMPAPTRGDGHEVMSGSADGSGSGTGEGETDGAVTGNGNGNGKAIERDIGSPRTPKSVKFAQVLDDEPSPTSDIEQGILQAQSDANSISDARTLNLLGLSFGACSGTLSGMSLLLAKCSVELLILSFAPGGHNQFKTFQSWLLLLGLAAAGLSQLLYLNHSLRFASPAIVCPFSFGFYNVTSIFDGLVFYSQFAVMKPHQIALVSVGIAFLLIGVYLVSAVNPTTGESGIEVRDWAEEPLLSEDEREEEVNYGLGYSDEPEENNPASAVGETSPASPASVSSPHSPTPGGRPPHRRTISASTTRFGTLIPELAPPMGVPMGFSIGLNTSSPGFVLRNTGYVDESADGESPTARSVSRRRSRSLGQQDLKDAEQSGSGFLIPTGERVGSDERVDTSEPPPRRTWRRWFWGGRGK